MFCKKMSGPVIFLVTIIVLSAKISFAAQWQQVPLRSQAQARAGLRGGEGMQMVQSIAYAPSNPQVLYLASDTSQIWKSRDGGDSWEMKHNGFYAHGGLSIGIDPHNENIVFVAGTVGYPVERYQPTEPLCGIFRTKNGGNSWELVKKTAYFKKVDGDNGGNFFVFFKNMIFAATYNDGLLKSEDGGDTWTSCGLKGVSIWDIKKYPGADSAIIFISSVNGLYEYNDANGQMNKIGAGLPDYPRTIAVSSRGGVVIYATVGKYGVYRSVDGGRNFLQRSNGLPQGKDYVHVSLSPANPDYLYVSVNNNSDHRLNPFYSHDAGASWHGPKTLDSGNLALFAANQRYFSAQIEPHPDEPGVAFTAANGKARILKTMDGGENWFYSAQGYTGGRMGAGKASLAFYGDSRKMAFFLIDFGPAVTENGGDTFRMLSVEKTFGHFTSNPAGAVSADGKTMVAAVGRWDKQLLEVSPNGGNSWSIVSGSEDGYRFIAFHPQKPDIVYAQGGISYDAGRSWKKLSHKVYAMNRGNGDIVYTVESPGGKGAVIGRSDDCAKTWKSPYPQLPVNIGSINEIEISPDNPDRIYLATNFGIGIYDDKSRKWLKKGEESGLSRDYFGLTAVKCIAADPRHPEIVYAGRWAPGKGQSNGVFRSTDYGETWENITFNLGEPITVWSIAVSPYDGTVYIGSSHGTWRMAAPY